MTSTVPGELYGPNGHRIQRIAPRIPVAAVTTYRIKAPLERNFRKATCAEIECPQWRDGWVSRVDESQPDQHAQANYIRDFSGRHFTTFKDEQGRTVFVFAAGQLCFAADSHVVSLEREPLYIVTGGDWRGNPRGERRIHSNAEDWTDDFGEHQDTLAARLEQG